MYLEYAEFVSEGAEDVTEEEFARHEMRAAKLIDRMTHGRIRDETVVRPCVRAAMRDLIAQSIAAEREDRQHGGREIASVSNDGISVSYAQQGGTQARRALARAQIIAEYLTGETTEDGVELLYAGTDA